MTDTHRQLLTIVELDLDRCPLTFGSSPCTAALSSTVANKCYNTRATCRVPFGADYQVDPETSLTADVTKESGDTVSNSEIVRDSDVFWAVDLTIPASSDGCIWEQGGTTNGLYFGVTSGNIVYRAGDATAADTVNTAKISVSATPYEGRTGTFMGTVDVSADTVALYWWDAKTRVLETVGTDTAASGLPSGNWTSTGTGAVGEVNGTVQTGESAADFTGTITELRIYNSTLGPLLTDTYRKTFMYSYNQEGLPKGQTIYPAIRSVKSSEARINPNGIDTHYGALGKRGSVTVQFQDFTDSDTFHDAYQSERVSGAAQQSAVGYDPNTRGTHFTKMIKRNPYYIGRALRIRTGAVGDVISAMDTRNYVISKWSGPDSNGNVSVTANDVLDLADNEKALCPKPTQGILDADITAASLSLNLEPAGIGSEYSTSGRASIGSEIVTFTRISDAITITARGVDGSSAGSHAQGDSFQECYRVDGVHVLDVIADLLKNYTGMPTQFIPADTWATELPWLGGFDLTATIPNPLGVKDLLSEISQLGLVILWDEINQTIGVKAVRPASIGEVPTDIDENLSVIEGSISVVDEPSNRLTRVRVNHGMINATAGLKDAGNYSVVNLHIDADAEGNGEYAQIQEREIFMRWLGSGQSSIAMAVASRLVSRYRDTPRTLTFEADTKDFADLSPSSLISVTSRLLVDDTGAEAATAFQVVRRTEPQPGHSVEVDAQSFSYIGRFGFIMENSANNYGSATDTEKSEGCYIVDATLTFADGTGPYKVF